MPGQLVNYNKSASQCSPNTDPSLVEELATILQMEEMLYLGKYLGCLIISGKVTNNTFVDIQEIKKASSKICK